MSPNDRLTKLQILREIRETEETLGRLDHPGTVKLVYALWELYEQPTGALEKPTMPTNGSTCGSGEPTDESVECICGKTYWPIQKWKHEKCGLESAMDYTERPSTAIRTPAPSQEGVGQGAVAPPKFDRNRYQRDLMRRRRESKAKA